MVGSKMRTFGPKSGVAVVGPPHVGVAVQLAGQLETGRREPDEAIDPVDEVLPAPPTPLPEATEPPLPPTAPEAELMAPDDGDTLTPDPTEVPVLAPLCDAPMPDVAPAPDVAEPPEAPDVEAEVCVPEPAGWAPDPPQP
jgi:hypothetical protein